MINNCNNRVLTTIYLPSNPSWRKTRLLNAKGPAFKAEWRTSGNTTLFEGYEIKLNGPPVLRTQSSQYM